MPGSFAVTVRTTYLIMGWLHDMSHTLISGAAQTQALMRWSVHLQQRQVHSTSPLSQEWQALLGPVTLVSEGEAEKTLKGEPIGPSLVRFQCHLTPHAKDSPLSGMLRTGLSATDPCEDKPCGLTYVQTKEVTLYRVTGHPSYVQGMMKQMHLLLPDG